MDLRPGDVEMRGVDGCLLNNTSRSAGTEM